MAKLSYHRSHHATVKSASSVETRLGAETEQLQPSDVAADFSQSSAPTSTQPQAAADVLMPYTTAETCDAEPPLAAVDAPAADRTIAAPASSSHASAPPSKRVCVDSHWPAGNTRATYKDHEMAEGRLCGDAQGSMVHPTLIALGCSDQHQRPRFDLQRSKLAARRAFFFGDPLYR